MAEGLKREGVKQTGVWNMYAFRGERRGEGMGTEIAVKDRWRVGGIEIES